jgi:hypothetical protein
MSVLLQCNSPAWPALKVWFRVCRRGSAHYCQYKASARAQSGSSVPVLTCSSSLVSLVQRPTCAKLSSRIAPFTRERERRAGRRRSTDSWSPVQQSTQCSVQHNSRFGKHPA